MWPRLILNEVLNVAIMYLILNYLLTLIPILDIQQFPVILIFVGAKVAMGALRNYQMEMERKEFD